MLCPNCGENNSLGRSHCVICRASLIFEQKTQPIKTKTHTPNGKGNGIGGWIGLGLSILAFNAAAPYIFSHPLNGGINWFEVACAAIVGAAGAILGKKLAGYFSKPKG